MTINLVDSLAAVESRQEPLGLGTTVFRIVDGKGAEEIGEEGALTALQQLGLVPAT
jgi:hypothetical protein